VEVAAAVEQLMHALPKAVDPYQKDQDRRSSPRRLDMW
jgi:hypothetical protein